MSFYSAVLCALLVGIGCSSEAPSPAPEPTKAPSSSPCKGKLSGDISAEFTCTVDAVMYKKNTATALTIKVAPLPPGVDSIDPASVSIPEPLKVGTYTLQSIGQGGAIIKASGKTYMASKEAGLGSLTLEVTRVEPAGPALQLSGSVKATLKTIEADGTLYLEVSF